MCLSGLKNDLLKALLLLPVLGLWLELRGQEVSDCGTLDSRGNVWPLVLSVTEVSGGRGAQARLREAPPDTVSSSNKARAFHSPPARACPLAPRAGAL